MLTIRIVGVVNILNDIAVQSINFLNYLPIGRPEIAISYLDRWGIDEIVILDIHGSNKESLDLHHHLPKYIVDCQTPVAAGGGIRKLNDIENLMIFRISPKKERKSHFFQLLKKQKINFEIQKYPLVFTSA